MPENATSVPLSEHHDSEWIDPSDEGYFWAQLWQLFIVYPGSLSCILLLHTVSQSRGRFKLLALLAVGDLLACLSEMFDSTYKIAIMMRIGDIPRTVATYKLPFTPRACLVFPHVHFYLLSEGWSALATVAISLERAISVFRPLWYNKMWNEGAGQRYVRWASAVVILHSMSGYFFVLLRDQTPGSVTISCSAYDSAGKPYLAYMDVVRMVTLSFASVVTAVAVCKAKSLLGKTGDKKDEIQARLTRTAVAVVVTSMIFELIPSLLRTLINNTDMFADNLVNLNAYAYGYRLINAGINYPLYLFINKEFRQASKKAFFGNGKIDSNTTKSTTQDANKQQ